MAGPKSESMLMVRALREGREDEAPASPNPMPPPERQPSALEQSLLGWGRRALDVPVDAKPLKGGGMITLRGRF